MSNASPSSSGPSGKLIVSLLVLALVLIFAACGFFGLYQFVWRPPGAPTPPVVDELPDIAKTLQYAKSRCEGSGRALLAAAKNGKITEADLEKGLQLYSDVKADYDGSIEYICFAMGRRFKDRDREEIDRQLKVADEKMEKFLT